MRVDSDELVRATKWMLRQPDGLHVIATAALGKTSSHLATHGTEATEDKRENLRLHLESHRARSGA